MAYGASIFTILLLGAGAIYINTAFFHNFPVLQFAIVAALALTAVAIFEPIRKFIQTPLEEKWITGWYDPTKVMSRIAEKLVPVLERDEAFRIVGEELKNAIKIKKVEILVGPECPKISEINRVGKSVEIPLKSSEGLEGVLRLGEKISEDPYDEKDLILFRTIQAQMVAVLDRTRPYEEIKKDLLSERGKLEIAEKELERAHRLAALGTLAAGLAHEIRNPMTVLRSRAERGLAKLGDQQFVKETYELMIKNVDRILNVVSRMLQFAKAKEQAWVRVDVNKVLEELLSLLEGKIRDKNLEVIKELKAKNPVMGNPDAVSEAFLNVLLNGIDFMERGGTLTVITREENENLVAEIRDTGIGISEDKLSRIFDPFFTTRAEGTGLGLSISYKIIKELGGTIEVMSKVGVGTEVTIKLPMALPATPF